MRALRDPPVLGIFRRLRRKLAPNRIGTLLAQRKASQWRRGGELVQSPLFSGRFLSSDLNQCGKFDG
jgi:hypothetical protein